MQRLNISLHVQNVNQKLSQAFWSLIIFWTLVLKPHLEFKISLQWVTLLAKAFFASHLASLKNTWLHFLGENKPT